MLLNSGSREILESPLDCKDIQPVHHTGNQSWLFIGRTDANLKLQYLATCWGAPTYLKRPWCWERLKAGGEGDDRGWDGWMASSTWWSRVWVGSRIWWWTVAKSRTRLSDFTFTFHFHALEKEMATHSSILAWRIPGTGEPGGLPSVGSYRVGHDWSDLAAA